MAKITEYDKVTELMGDEVLLLDGVAGTKNITATDLAKALLLQWGPIRVEPYNDEGADVIFVEE